MTGIINTDNTVKIPLAIVSIHVNLKANKVQFILPRIAAPLSPYLGSSKPSSVIKSRRRHSESKIPPTPSSNSLFRPVLPFVDSSVVSTAASGMKQLGGDSCLLVRRRRSRLIGGCCHMTR